MGLFRKKSKEDKDQQEKDTSENYGVDDPVPTLSSSNENNIACARRLTRFNRQVSLAEEEPAIDQLNGFIHELELPDAQTSREARKYALKMLFSLSEHDHDDNRTIMVRAYDGKLVSALLDILVRCERGSREQSLILLVLNNISIPCENKRIIAVEKDGAKILARALLEDPSCHLLAIILVNLTFADVNLRKELLAPESEIGLVESLAYAFRVACLTPEEFEERKQFIGRNEPELKSPGERLAVLMAEDQRLRPAPSNGDHSAGKLYTGESIGDPSRQLFPDTARWCLSALKNLTRPCRDGTAAHILIKSGIFSIILQDITITKVANSLPTGTSDSSSESATAVDPVEEFFTNTPSSWHSQSTQDAALFICLNLSACPASRDYVYEADAVNILTAITEAPSHKLEENKKLTHDEKCQQDFQCLKARMALAYLLGSQGSFGQSKMKKGASTKEANPSDHALVMTDAEVELLLELLSNTLHSRGKDGPGGYSAATFSLKYVLLAIRCLLTHTLNQEHIANIVGLRFNSLLLKVLACHVFAESKRVYAEAAEFACFSLYLQSNYGFKSPFLPTDYTEEIPGMVVAQILTPYLADPDITPAGKHAAEQIVLRLKYLVFEGTIAELAGNVPTIVSDWSLDDSIRSKVNEVKLGKVPYGARPGVDIFDRPILRCRKPKKGENVQSPWNNKSSFQVFPNALQAVQQLSYGSPIVRHLEQIDDISIANNIANSANGIKTQSYNFFWTWEDKANEIQKNLDRTSSDVKQDSNILKLLSNSNDNEPVTILGLHCGPLCASDTT